MGVFYEIKCIIKNKIKKSVLTQVNTDFTYLFLLAKFFNSDYLESVGLIR